MIVVMALIAGSLCKLKTACTTDHSHHESSDVSTTG
jgi:hypothetical protein